MKSITKRQSIIACLMCVLVLFSNKVNADKKVTTNQQYLRTENKKVVSSAEKVLQATTVSKAANSDNNPANTNTATAKSDQVVVNTGISPIFEPVQYVKEISAAGKASLELQNSGDKEYIKLIQNGFESPTFNSKIVENVPTAVQTPANINYLWRPQDPKDQKLWQNVEFNRYNNRLLDTTRYSTPAHFTINEVGNTVVHAPSDQGLQIISPATTTLTSSNTFLEVADVNLLMNSRENLDSADKSELENNIENKVKSLYSFLK